MSTVFILIECSLAFLWMRACAETLCRDTCSYSGTDHSKPFFEMTGSPDSAVCANGTKFIYLANTL